MVKIIIKKNILCRILNCDNYKVRNPKFSVFILLFLIINIYYLEYNNPIIPCEVEHLAI